MGRPTAVAIDKKNGLSNANAHSSNPHGWAGPKTARTLAELDAESDSEENAHKTRPRIRAMPCGSQKDPTSTAKPSTLHGRSKTEAIHDAKTLAQLDSESDSEEDARGSKLHGWSARKNPK
eukprot:Platyproteum_vivax@DN1364_c0_g1_i2.p2